MAVRMRICVPGNCCFRRAVHSIPDMRGKKMSIRITSGFSSGMTRSASSPLAQEQTQRKSGKELIRRVQLSRTLGWSSTSATFKGILDEGSAERFAEESERARLLAGGVICFEDFIRVLLEFRFICEPWNLARFPRPSKPSLGRGFQSKGKFHATAPGGTAGNK